MTDSTAPTATVPLGVGTIVSESFSILGKNFIKVMILGFIGAFLGFLFNGLFLGFGMATGLEEPDPFNFPWVGLALSLTVPMVIYGIVTALMVQLAYDAKLGRSNSLGVYFGPALRAAIPIAILSIVVIILTSLGAIALVVGALWVYAVFSVMAPAVMIERAGFGALGRSAELTKNYRWPIVGALILIWIGIFILQMLVGVAIGAAFVSLADSTVALIGIGVLMSLVNALGYGLGGISVSLIYARLREIKEGVGVDEIAKVFE